MLPLALLCLSVVLSGCRMKGVQIEQSPLLRLLEVSSGLIAFQGPDGNVYTIDQKGKGRRAVTRDAGTKGDLLIRYGLSTWSPDGKLIAFPAFTVSSQGELVEARIVTAARNGTETGRYLQSAALAPIYLSWAPDSSRIAILSSSIEQGTLELGVASLDAGGYTPLDHGSPYYWDWSADNRTLIAHVNSGPGEERLSLIRADAPWAREDLPVSPAVFQAPDLSRDGRYLAYVSTREAESALLLRDLSSGEERTLTTAQGPLYFSLSPDGSSIAVLHALGVQPVPYGTLQILSLDGKTVRTTQERLVLGSFWSPDGRRIAFLAAGDGGSADAAFLADPQALYLRLDVIDPRSGASWTVATFPPTRELVELLPFLDQYVRSVTPWSPDGKHLVFTAYSREGDPSVYVARAAGGIKPRLLTPGDAAFWSWR